MNRSDGAAVLFVPERCFRLAVRVLAVAVGFGVFGGIGQARGGALAGTSVADSTVSDPSKGPSLPRWLESIIHPGGGRFVFLPRVTNSSEAGWGVGGELGANFTWPALGGARTRLDLDGRATFGGDGEVAFTVDLESPGDRYAFRARAVFDNIPRGFYGVGPDVPESNREIYQRQSVLGYVEAFRGVSRHLKVGLRLEAENHRMLGAEPGRALDAGRAPGIAPVSIAGGGILLAYDSRDRHDSPRRGEWFQFFALRFGAPRGPSTEFNAVNLDLRWYRTPREGHVLALQAFVYSTDDDAPFWRLASIGERAHSRGYREFRYIDHVMAALQAEYRIPLFWKIGLSGFAGAAETAPRFAWLRGDNLRPTVGGGVRVQFGGGGVARADLAYGEGVHGYLELNESF